MKKLLFYIFVISLIALSLLFPEKLIYYSRDSLRMCADIIIPTLFPFFVCSGLLIYSGFGSVLARAAAPLMRPVFNVAPAGAAAFALGIISGFPLGAVTAADLYRCGSLSRSEAERLLAFCNNSGPLFIIGTVGAAIYGSPALGVILYLIHISASVIVGIIFSRYKRKRHSSPPLRLMTNEMPLSEVFATALSNASKSILTVCFSIIFFSTFSRVLLDLLPLPSLLYAVASAVTEFSTGVLNVSYLDIGIYEKLVLTSFIIGFSGLCVHIQVMAVTAGAGLDLKPYVFGKLLHGTVAAIATAGIMRILPFTAATFSGCSARLSAAFLSVPLMLAAGAITLIPAALFKISSSRHANDNMYGRSLHSCQRSRQPK